MALVFKNFFDKAPRSTVNGGLFHIRIVIPLYHEIKFGGDGHLCDVYPNGTTVVVLRYTVLLRRRLEFDYRYSCGSLSPVARVNIENSDGVLRMDCKSLAPCNTENGEDEWKNGRQRT